MESKVCYWCKQSAAYGCPCTTPYTLICKTHLDMHLSLPGNHLIKILKNSGLELNIKSKADLLNKIFQIKAETLNQKKILLDFVDKSINNIISQGKKILEDLDGFVETCEKVTKEILYKNSISLKQFYNPIENALISNDIEGLLSKFHAPSVKYKKIERLLDYVPSLFPHFLYNYSEFTFGYSYINTINFYPIEKKLNNKKFDMSMRGLSLNNNSVLITGPESKTFLLNIENETMSELFDLNQPRK